MPILGFVLSKVFVFTIPPEFVDHPTRHFLETHKRKWLDTEQAIVPSKGFKIRIAERIHQYQPSAFAVGRLVLVPAKGAIENDTHSTIFPQGDPGTEGFRIHRADDLIAGRQLLILGQGGRFPPDVLIPVGGDAHAILEG